MDSQIIDIPHELVNGNGKEDHSGPEIIVLKFADSRIPIFKEDRRKDYIKYGENNMYGIYLTHLFNKSGKHGAIINGKANYIFGEGYENGDAVINRTGESLNDISKKAILDIELYGGFRLEILWNKMGKIAEIYHVDFTTIRTGKEGCYYYKENWDPMNRDEEIEIPGFDPMKPEGSQIYAYNEYRPGQKFYPLPSYIACLNYVETDIEISKFNLSAIRNGMNPSKMIQFFKGEPSEDKKREIERKMANKFAGAENAGKFLLVFNDSNSSKSVEVNDLSANDLDKMYDLLNKTCQQEIFSGHLVTSPMLFGIKTEGQLGGVTELKTAYEIFVNTYAKPKANSYDKEINYLLSYSLFPAEYELRQTDPIGLQFDVKDVVNSLPKAFVFTKMGIPEDQWNLPNIGSDNKAADIPLPVGAPVIAPTAAIVNDNIKNLTGRQHQGIMRIVRQFEAGKLQRAAAAVMLKTGYGLSDEDVVAFLGDEPAKLAASFSEQEDEIIGMFDACGDSKLDYEILRTKKVYFSEQDAEADEEIYIKEAFKTYDVTTSENQILELIKKDKRITPEVIATTIKQTVSYVKSKINSLTKRGYLESTSETIGVDTIIERTVPSGIDIITPPSGKISPAAISIKYSYEVKPRVGPELIPTSRPFCIRMIGLNRLYSRADIENISQRLGYSVFDRKGGWWGKNPECRHRWVSHIVLKKGGEK